MVGLKEMNNGQEESREEEDRKEDHQEEDGEEDRQEEGGQEEEMTRRVNQEPAPSGRTVDRNR
jgi:hypothetical protein